MFINFAEKSQVYLRLHHDYSISRINSKLFNQRIESFSILEKIDNLAYRLKFSDVMRIHPIISITQLKSFSNRSENSYHRTFTQSVPSIKKTQNNLDPNFITQYRLYIIERLLNRRGTKKNVKYLVK